MLISEEYRQINRFMLEHKNYGVSGQHWSVLAHTYATALKAQKLLDYGCGNGNLVTTLPKSREYEVAEYDPGVPGKDDPPDYADFVSCTDVLEHIEPECLLAVLDDIFRLAVKGALLVVATAPAAKHLPDGRNAHLIVQSSDWWLPLLLSRWQLRHFEDYGGMCFTYFGTPRCKPR